MDLFTAGLEKRGEFRQACQLLDQLLATLPQHREARLRLAVNLARSGNRPRARRILTELVAAPGKDWLQAVAFHELARDLIARDRFDEAKALLLAARERLPDDDQLQLLLAVARDALQGGAAAGDFELGLRSRADRPSARHRYQEWPEFTPGAATEVTSQRLEALAAALQGLRSEA